MAAKRAASQEAHAHIECSDYTAHQTAPGGHSMLPDGSWRCGICDRAKDRGETFTEKARRHGANV